MPEWSRNTPWRQGRLLTEEAIRANGLIHSAYPDETVVIVATHDCDLAQPPDKEPQVEVVVGRRIQALNGSHTNAKTSRTLHIGFEGNEQLLAEFVITEKRSIPKITLVDFGPLTDVALSPSDLKTFQIWLASRYARSAFPDEFEHRLRKSGLAENIKNTLRSQGEMIIAVYFEIDDGEEIAHTGRNDVYMLNITLLHKTEPDPDAALAAAEQAKITIKTSFEEKLLDPKSRNWKDIELQYIDVVSDEAFSVRLSRKYKKWPLDYISLGATPQQPVLAE